MAQSMNVSVVLRLQDAFTGPVRGIIQQMQGLTRAAQEFNRALGGTGSNTTFGRIQNQARALNGDVRQLAQSFAQLGRSMGAQSGGGLVQGQIGSMQRLLGLQQQALRNQTHLNAGGGGGRGPAGPGGGIWGRRGFSPNASLADRAQYRAVNLGEQSLVSGFLDLDRPRTQLGMLTLARPGHQPVLTQEDLAVAESAAAELSTTFRSLSRGHILETFRELVPMFNRVDDAFAMLPEMLRIQDWQVLQGDTAERAREGMLSLLRAVGLSGRLIGPDGRLKLDEASGFMESYLRARMIGGRDITPDQVFQFMKYAKATGQSMSPEALLEAFIAMPDIRGSTFGNQLNMLVRQMTGRATQASQSAMEQWGLGRITERTQSGGHGFAPVDEELLRSDTSEWFKRHITGPTGVLRRMGIDPLRASSAQISTGLSRFFSNQSAENIANMIVNQQTEWRNQVLNALGIDLSEVARQRHAAGSGWHQFSSARSGLQDVLGSVGENLKTLFNPALEAATDGLKKLARWIDPKTAHPDVKWGLLGAGGIAGFLAARSIWRGMGPMGRSAVGGGLGFLVGGGPTDLLMGALLGRSVFGGGAAATAAAGAAGAAAAQTWGSQFLGVLRGVLRMARGMLLLGVAAYVVDEILSHWDKFKERMVAIFADIRKAAPVWLGGDGEGWRAIASGQGLPQIGQDLRNRLTTLGITGPEHGTPYISTPLNDEFRSRPWWDLGAHPPWDVARDLWNRTTGTAPASASPSTVNVAPGAVVVNITAPSGDANAIGAAAGNAVGSALRGVMGDTPNLGSMAVP